MKEYQEKFEEYATRTTGLSEEFFVSCFISGLKEEIRMTVQMFKPITISQALGLARLQEENILAMAKRNRFNTIRQDQFKPVTLEKTQSKPNEGAGPTTIKWLTLSEMDERRSKGLCFNCDEQFKPGHRCKRRQLYLIEADNSDHENEELSEEDQEAADEDVKISVNSITGTLAPKAMRVKGYIKHRQVSILIDSGSTHNFVDPGVAKRTGCKLETTLPFKVTVANGHEMRSDAICKKFCWVMHGSEFFTDVRLLPLRGYDVVLGTTWLETLGDIVWNFAKLRMEFYLNDK
ncbi:uncharacterized protein LOC143877215 [Tasmannia lanceolata]|uniref:uncharacterized protein LOC143877215 n=1 Tax=Tasmannia lanceolata TaxID=3420 RepID=UPI00406326A3